MKLKKPMKWHTKRRLLFILAHVTFLMIAAFIFCGACLAQETATPLTNWIFAISGPLAAVGAGLLNLKTWEEVMP